MREKKKAAPITEIEFPKHYFVLGADLSLTRPGFALLDIENINGKAVINSVKLGNVDNKTKRNKSHGQLLAEILDYLTYIFMPLSDVVEKTPIFFVREKEIMHLKIPSERSVTKVVGIMDWQAYVLYKSLNDDKKFNGIWYEIYPVSIKSLIGGSGKADKQQVADGLDYYLGKQEYSCDDESDAAAVAVAWLIQHGQIDRKEQKVNGS